MTTLLTTPALAAAALLVYEIHSIPMRKKHSNLAENEKTSATMNTHNLYSENIHNNRIETIFYIIALAISIFPFLSAEIFQNKGFDKSIPEAANSVTWAFSFIFFGILTKLFKRDFVLFAITLIIIPSGVFLSLN